MHGPQWQRDVTFEIVPSPAAKMVLTVYYVAMGDGKYEGVVDVHYKVRRLFGWRSRSHRLIDRRPTMTSGCRSQHTRGPEPLARRHDMVASSRMGCGRSRWRSRVGTSPTAVSLYPFLAVGILAALQSHAPAGRIQSLSPPILTCR